MVNGLCSPPFNLADVREPTGDEFDLTRRTAGQLEIVGDPVPELNDWLHGLHHLPVCVTPH